MRTVIELSRMPRRYMKETRLRQLDGLRTFAVLAVVVEHSMGWPHTDDQAFSPWVLGTAGVRLFFVLSGFLITGILLKARAVSESEGSSMGPTWRAFYIRRALRIFPLAYAAILFAYLIGVPTARADGWWYAAYLSNVLCVLRGQIAPWLGHFWSLAVEEQFYLVWPLLILWIPRQSLRPWLIMVIVLAAGCRGMLVSHGLYLPAYVLSVPRFDALAFGGLLALHERPSIVWLFGGGAALIAVGAVVHPTVAAIVSEWGTIAVSSALIVYAARQPTDLVGRFLASPPLVYVGTISYGVYVLHLLVPFVVKLTEQRFDIWLRFPAPGPWQALYTAIASIMAASVSWFVLERPLNALKRYAPYVTARRRVVAVTSPAA